MSVVLAFIAFGPTESSHADEVGAPTWEFHTEATKELPNAVSIAAPYTPSARLGVTCKGYSDSAVAFVDLDPAVDIDSFAIEDFGVLEQDQASALYNIDGLPGFNDWWRSSSGAALFVLKPTEPIEFVRRLAFAQEIEIGITSDRSRVLGGNAEPTFWAEFDLTGGEEPIRRMMAICGQPLVERHRELPGYPFGLGYEIDLWGPKATTAYKNLLHELGYYDGPIDGNKDDEFYLSITDMLDEFAHRCRAGEFSEGMTCSMLRAAQAGGYGPGSMRPFLALFELNYDATAKALQDIGPGD